MDIVNSSTKKMREEDEGVVNYWGVKCTVTGE